MEQRGRLHSDRQFYGEEASVARFCRRLGRRADVGATVAGSHEADHPDNEYQTDSGSDQVHEPFLSVGFQEIPFCDGRR